MTSPTTAEGGRDQEPGSADAPTVEAPAGRRRGGATIYDIARLAHVNPSTVSRALNRPSRVNADTVRRIRDAAAHLDYQPNPMARALPTGRTGMLGLIVADVANPILAPLMSGAEEAASDADYTLVLAESQESGEREAAVLNRVAPAVDAVVLLTARLADRSIRELSRRKPVVVVNRITPRVPGVIPDLDPGIDEAIAHLHTLGHRSIAYLAGPQTSWMSAARWERIFAGAIRLDMNVVEIGPNRPTVDGGRAAFPRVEASGVTAVIAYNDLIALGLLEAATQHARPVPQRLSIIGFDNIFGTDFSSPPLTTVEMPFAAMGKSAVQTAIRLLQTGDGGPDGARDGSAPPADAPTRLIIRGSTGRPR